MSEFFFPLFFWGILCLSGVTLDTLYPCPDITERLELSFLVSISMMFLIFVHLSDKLDDEIDLDLFTDFNVTLVSVLLVDLDISNYLTFSDLMLLFIFLYIFRA